MTATVKNRPARLDWQVTIGDDATLTATFYQSTVGGTPVNLTGKTLQLRLPTHGSMAEVTLDARVAVSSPSSGVVRCELTDADTTALAERRRPWYLRDDTGDQTLLAGDLVPALPGDAGVSSGSTAVAVVMSSGEVTVVTAPQGLAGPPGPGVPTGGSTGQVLVKTSGTDYATAWTTPANPTVAAGLAIAVSAVDGTATTWHLLAHSPASPASSPIPAGWVSRVGPLPIVALPAGSPVVVPGDGTVGATPGAYTRTASGAWTARPLTYGQPVRAIVSQAVSASTPVEVGLIASNRSGAGATPDPAGAVTRLDVDTAQVTADTAQTLVAARTDALSIHAAVVERIRSGGMTVRSQDLDPATAAGWVSTDLSPTLLTTQFDFRALSRSTGKLGSGRYGELVTLLLSTAPDDDIVEWAKHYIDPAFPALGPGDSFVAFLELMLTGDTEERSDPLLHVPGAGAPHLWCLDRITGDLTTGTFTVQVGAIDRSPGVQVCADGSLWRTIRQVTLPSMVGGLKATGDRWHVGKDFRGHVAWVEIRDVIDSAVPADRLDFTALSAGATSHTTPQGHDWTGPALVTLT